MAPHLVPAPETLEGARYDAQCVRAFAEDWLARKDRVAPMTRKMFHTDLFSTLYVRVWSTEVLALKAAQPPLPTLVIANVAVHDAYRGQGLFAAFLESLLAPGAAYRTILFELVHNPELARYLERKGFTLQRPEEPFSCSYLRAV